MLTKIPGSLTSSESVELTVKVDRTGIAPNNYSGFINVVSQWWD